MLAATLAMTVALVVGNQTTLRSAAHDNAPAQTTLTAGDWLEVRGESHGYLSVYDHRHERAGYVKPSVVRTYTLDEASAPKLSALVDYWKAAEGAESLGIGFVALYLRAAPAGAATPDTWSALGAMAERLAKRASSRVAKGGDSSLASELEVAESYGVHFKSFDHGGVSQVCYDGEAFERVLAMGGDTPQRLHAALGLTDPRCLDPAAGATATLATLKQRVTALQAVDVAKVASDVPVDDGGAFRVRRAIVNAELAYYAARTGDAALAKESADKAKGELALADKAVLADDQRPVYEEAALRVAAVRYASAPTPAPSAASTLDVAVVAGQPGQTCVRVTSRAPGVLPFQHCTYAVVWPSSVRTLPHDAGVTFVSGSLEGWSELVVVHRQGDQWTADAVPPAEVDPELGYAELAGASADGTHLLVVREYRASGPLGAPHTLAPWMTRTFQVVRASDLHVEREAHALSHLPQQSRFESADWKGSTLALR